MACADTQFGIKEEASLPLWQRLWQYQRERFPLVAHAPLVLLFSGAACAYSRALRGVGGLPTLGQWGLAFGLCLGFFFLLRVADEVKDREIDARYQPERAIPRGLVTLPEVVWTGVVVAVLQTLVAVWAAPGVLLVLIVGWAYFAAMSVEFGVGEWLRARLWLYLLTHMGVMPLVDWLATACDWAGSSAGMPAGLGWFLAASYSNGLVIEIGRKLRSPQNEREGVDTYTACWGPRPAVAAWLAALAATAFFAWRAVALTGFTAVVMPLLGLAGALALIMAAKFWRKPEEGGPFEALAGLWTAALYGGMLAAAVIF